MITDKEIQKALQSISNTPSKEWSEKTLANLTSELIKQQQKSYFLFFGMKPKYFAMVLLAALVLSSGAGLFTVQAAQNSRPGDFLFGLEKTLEEFDRNRLQDDSTKLEFENEVLQERIKETENIQETQDVTRLTLSLDELKAQYQRLIQEKLKCTNCSEELLLKIENTIAQLSDRSYEIKIKAKENGNVEVEIEAEGLENESREFEFEVEDEALEAEHQEENENKENLSETEKRELEQQQEQEKQQLEAQQEAQKKLLEQQRESTSGSGSSNNNSGNDSNDDSEDESEHSGSNSGSGNSGSNNNDD